ncbi:MAG: RNA-binding cell elongation regulator Jag/EloR [Bacilli bacterium]|jgi:spoIIIJ-associated protein
MKLREYEAKTKEEALAKAEKDYGLTEKDLFLIEREEEGGLFKTKKIKLEVISKEEVIEYCKSLLKNITEKMGIETKCEVKNNEDYLKFSLYSDNNSVLIGKGGRTIESLQVILRSSLSNQLGFRVNVSIDVEDYKEKQLQRIEYLARKIANEVKATGNETKLDAMNSYERRIVHEEVSKVEGITTVSEGEEPNRYIIIKCEK